MVQGDKRDKVKKVDSLVAYVDRDYRKGKNLIQCSARYIIDGDPGNSGIVCERFEIPDGLSFEDAAYYSKQLFAEGLKKKGYIVENG